MLAEFRGSKSASTHCHRKSGGGTDKVQAVDAVEKGVPTWAVVVVEVKCDTRHKLRNPEVCVATVRPTVKLLSQTYTTFGHKLDIVDIEPDIIVVREKEQPHLSFGKMSGADVEGYGVQDASVLVR